MSSTTEAPIAHWDDVERRRAELGHLAATWRDLGRAAGSVKVGLKRVEIDPGKWSTPAHVEGAEEELFVVLEGDGHCILGEDEHPIRAGHVVSRPAGTRIAHCFRGGESGMHLLVYGTRESNDIAYYPRSNKVYFRGVGLITRLEQLDYMDGEI